MAVTINTAQNLPPNAFAGAQTVTGMTTTTATSEAHGQTIDTLTGITVLAGGTEAAVANVYQLASGREGQEKWITTASATGMSMIALTLATAGFSLTSTATEFFTATTALVLGAADDSYVALKFVNNKWHLLYNAGATAATASSPFA